MNWLNPILLWGLTALMVPVFIHFWSKNKTKEIAFGSIRFLRESSTLQSKRIQFSEILLLLLRLLILILVVMLMAKWVSYHSVEKQKAVLLGENVNMPQAYANEEIRILNSSEFDEKSNQWHLLKEISLKHPEVDSLIYINNFEDTDFIGAIPQLYYHLNLIASNQNRNTKEILDLDTVLIHFDKLPQAVKDKFDKLMKTNHLYTGKKLNFKLASKREAQLVFTDSPQNQDVNQIVLSDTISGNYQVQRKYNYSLLYLNENWLENPLHEDVFVSVVTEFIAQLLQPNFIYSSFDSVYTRKSDGQETAKKAKAFDHELFWLIVLLIMLERYFSYRKKHA